MVTFWVLVLSLPLCAAEGEGALRNGGFEIMEGAQPANWNLFVQPEPGAEGRIDKKTFAEGAQAIFLHNPDSYKQDPCNNWSQNLSNKLAEKNIIVGGRVKTSGSASAAIWVQCWRKDPWRVLRVASTSDTNPVQGDTDWTAVAASLTVPGDTDFVVVRCVIRGSGDAWFDDIRLVPADATAPDSSSPPATPAVPAAPAAPVAAPAPPAPATPGPSDELAHAAAEMAKTIAALRATNDSLSRDLGQMRQEIAELRAQLAPRPPAPAKPSVPPLIPHGYIQEDDLK